MGTELLCCSRIFSTELIEIMSSLVRWYILIE